MKFQLVIISALLVSAYTLPVPDEEVSPVVQAAPQVQEKHVELKNADEKVIDAVKPAESRSASETLTGIAAAPIEEKKNEKLPELPLNTPDAELNQSLPAAEKKEEKKDKQTRGADDKVEEAKALPVAAASPVAPIAAGFVAEEPQQAEETKPLIASIDAAGESSHIEGKSTSTIIAEAVPAEQKKDELLAAEETPIVKTESAFIAAEASSDSAPAVSSAALTSTSPLAAAAAAPATLSATEAKKDETPAARQERVGESVNEVDAKVGPVAPVDANAAVVGGAVGDVVVPAVKSLPAEENSPAAVGTTAEAEKAQAIKEQLKTAIHAESAGSKSEATVAHAPAGDITHEASEESSAAKSLKTEEQPAQSAAGLDAKKFEETAPSAAAPTPAELTQEQQKEIKPEIKESEPKILEERRPANSGAEIEKLSEKKKSGEANSSDSAESKESSSESKEDDSD